MDISRSFFFFPHLQKLPTLIVTKGTVKSRAIHQIRLCADEQLWTTSQTEDNTNNQTHNSGAQHTTVASMHMGG